nr:histone chaperone ASF1-like [Pogona vitticeps]
MTSQVQKSFDEEEADDVEEDDEEEYYDEKKDDIKEEQDTTEQNVNQIPEYEGQNIKSCGSEEKSYVLTETIKKENAILEKDTSKQEGENAEVCVTNTSDLAVAGSRDRTSGRLLDKVGILKMNNNNMQSFIAW